MSAVLKDPALGSLKIETSKWRDNEKSRRKQNVANIDNVAILTKDVLFLLPTDSVKCVVLQGVVQFVVN